MRGAGACLVEVPVDAGLVVEADVQAPLVEAEVGGSAGVSSGGLCNLICGKYFYEKRIFLLQDNWVYYGIVFYMDALINVFDMLDLIW